jgi:peptidyl-prolyl cis-trans isomerase B (cyclophilin B)
VKPFHIFVFILILFIFGIVFYAIQSTNVDSQKSALDIINQVSPSPGLYNRGNLGLAASGQPQQQEVDQQKQLQQVLEQIKVASITATITTPKGTIKMDLYGDSAPITVYNFISKAQNKYYDGLKFHRVEDWVIQGGDPKGNGTGGTTNIPTELNNRPYVAGSVGMARMNDPKVQNDSQFFITKSESSHLNGQYTNFGQVTSGLEVVEKIEIGDKITSLTVDIK